MKIVRLLDLLFPKKCAGCGEFGTYFCTSCIQSSKLRFPLVCPVCERSSVDGVTHVPCRERFSPDGLTSVWMYEKAPRELILKLKYKYVTDVGLSLAVPASGTLKNIKRNSPASPKWTDKLVLVPIPLHWTRKNWRGFNHVEEVGKILARLMGWQVVNLLERSKMAKQQVGLKGKERKSNVEGVFSMSKDYRLAPNDYCLILFDDVWTTGATMLEAVKVLKKAGFKKVWCLTLAR